MAGLVYILCAITSLVCSVMLLKAYFANRFRLLFWCGLGFIGFALNNVLLFLDLIVVPEIDIVNFRTLPALLGMVVMIYGLIMEEV